eukprot:5841797-Alexandrium_andersonii.AAC.1
MSAPDRLHAPLPASEALSRFGLDEALKVGLKARHEPTPHTWRASRLGPGPQQQLGMLHKPRGGSPALTHLRGNQLPD